MSGRMEWEAIFFDFDGVIADSVNVKTEAFAEMFKPFGEGIQQRVVEYHLSHGGVSRYEKFRHWYKEFFNIDLKKEEIDKLSERFSELVFRRVINAPFIIGAKETLEYCAKNSIPSYIVSGTPEEEIKRIVLERGLDRYFIEVHGSPRKKDEITNDILNRKKYEPSMCLFIGDSISDYDAAMKNGMRFLGIVGNDKESVFPKGTWVSFRVTLDIEKNYN